MTFENEEHCEDPLPLSRSPTISVTVKSMQQQKELPISDVEYKQEEPLMETLEQNFAKMESSLSDYQPSFTAVSSTLSNEPVGQEKEETAAKESTVQPLSISDAVRQMLQDEMFKLVQLQQINFMSLMQVVGSSFASLPNVSQQIHQTQPSQLGRSQASNAGDSDVESSPHKHPADGFPKSQMPVLENHGTVNMEDTGTHGKNDLCNENHNETILNPPHIGDSSHLPENQSSRTRLIPPFQSFLPQVPSRPLPLLSFPLNSEKKPKLIPMAKPTNGTDGLPLLKLNPNYGFQSFSICSIKTPENSIDPHSQQRQFWGLPSFVKNPQGLSAPEHKNVIPVHLNLNSYDLKGIRQAQEQKNNWEGPMSKETSRHLHLDENERKENMSHSQQFHVRLKAEKPMAEKEIPLHKTYENFSQFPLLHLKSCTQSKHPSASVPVEIVGKDTDSRDLWQTGLPLLYANLPPLIKFQTPKLIPLQDLIAFQQSRQAVHVSNVRCKDHPEKFQLLKADITTHEARGDKNSKNRQKRRVEKQIKKAEREKKTATLQQDDSTGLADTLEQTKANQTEFSYDLNDGNILLNPETVISSAGLHYLASVRKMAPHHQETSTNTDTVLKSHQNIQTNLEEIVDESSKNQQITFASVSTSVTGLQPAEETQMVSEVPSELSEKLGITCASPSLKDVLPSCALQTSPPDLHLNLTFRTEETKQTLPFSSDMTEQKYINVIDIEDDDFMKNLPDISEPTPKLITRQSMKAEFPTSAELHHMAASVTNIISPDEFDRERDTLHTKLVQVPPETIENDVLSDPLTVNMLHEDFSTTYSRRLSARKISKEHISAKLQEMDRQLMTLQNVAERMEEEFRNTKLVVETVEEVSLVTDPRNSDISFFAPDVKISKEEYYSTRLVMEDFTEEDDDLETKSQTSDLALQSQTSDLALQTPSASSVSVANLLGVKTSSPDLNFNSEELDESIADNHLEITGLSGVSDIITDLIVEQAISASDLGLTETQAQRISRLSSAVNRYSRKTEKDKKELQTWMKTKRKERLAEYVQTLAEQREKEHSPFPLRKRLTPGLSSRDIKLQQKKKDEKDKALFSEHHNLRVSEALNLMHELLTDTMQLPSSDYKLKSSSDFKRPCIASAGSTFRGSFRTARSKAPSKSNFYQTKSFSSLSSDINQRKGQVRQAPYRRISSENNQGQMQWKSHRNQRQWSKSRLNLNNRASDRICRSVTQKRFPTTDIGIQANDESEDDAMSVWSVPGEIQQILYGSSNGTKESLLPEDACSTTSFNNVDSVSESTSSILSKLDWKAVEALVANEEEK